jgi:hypothetical protein
VTRFEFVKSSYSTSAGECVEVATNIPGTVAVRDSKDPDGEIVRFSPAAWQAFQFTDTRGEKLPVSEKPAPDTESGRGLLLVEALATRCDVALRPIAPGKTVWADHELPNDLPGCARLRVTGLLTRQPWWYPAWRRHDGWRRRHGRSWWPSW